MKKHNASVPLNLVRSSRTRLAGVLLGGLIMTLAPLARAGTIGISGGSLIVGTEPGDGSQSITGAISGTNLVISGVNFDLVTPGCSVGGPGSFFCPLGGFNQLFVLGGDGDDAVELTGITAQSFAITIMGGPGADVLVGSGGHDNIFGDAGDDVLIAGTGGDCLSGGAGDNLLIGSVCTPGPEPAIAPLAREGAEAPEPAGFLLVATGLGLLAIGMIGRNPRQRANLR